MIESIELNGSKWDVSEESQTVIKSIAKVTDDDTYIHGYTNYYNQTILIDSVTKNKERVLIHEITHAWLDAYGHNQFDKNFTNEDVCEIVSAIYPTLKNVIEE